MKKIILLLISLSLIFTVGCGNRPTSAPETPQSQTTQQGNTTDNPALIGEEKAKTIALEQAGISQDNVKFIKTELDRDHNVIYYEIEFIKDNIEYDVDIDAEDGTVLAFEKDYRD